MFKNSIHYMALIILLAMGGGCGQNEGGHEGKFLVSGNGNLYMPADEKRCLDTLTMFDKTRFEASAIFMAKAGVTETSFEECLERIINDQFENN